MSPTIAKLNGRQGHWEWHEGAMNNRQIPGANGIQEFTIRLAKE